MAEKRNWRIAVVPGDGVGQEVIDSALAVLAHLRQQGAIQCEWDRLPWPSTAWHQQHGAMMPDDALERLADYDAILLGALGDPGPLSQRERYRLPDGISLAPLLDIRKGFDLWACERPAHLLNGAHQYLADDRAREVDMLVVRENSEGEYVNQGGRLHRGTPHEIATQVEVFSRYATERLIRHAFKRARQRLAARQEQGQSRSFIADDGSYKEAQVCLVTKRNALQYWGELYTDVFAEVAEEFPDIATHHELVDAACMKFVQAPWQFDVVAASNLQGDILTDLAAVLSGGMGIAPSSNINPNNRDLPPLFEPTHGSAPDIAGLNRADPRAMLLTLGMLLQWLGEEDSQAAQAALLLQQAVERDLQQHVSEPARSTQAITDSIIEQLN